MEAKTKILLEQLEPLGLGSYHDISPLLNEFFPVTNRHDASEVHFQARVVQDFFTALLKANYIKGKDSEIRGLGSGNTTNG